MGGGSTPAPATPVAVPSATDEEAAEERARLYSLLRSRRGGRSLAYGPARRTSLLAAATPKTTTSPAASVLAEVVSPWLGGGGSGGTGDSGGFGGSDGGHSSDSGGGMGSGGGADW